jgi:hypothetical protein
MRFLLEYVAENMFHVKHVDKAVYNNFISLNNICVTFRAEGYIRYVITLLCAFFQTTNNKLVKRAR